MPAFFRWQWMWKSRLRLLSLAIAAMVIGGAVIAFAVTRGGPFRKSIGLMIAGGVTLVAMGGYQTLQGILSPAGAFGEESDR